MCGQRTGSSWALVAVFSGGSTQRIDSPRDSPVDFLGVLVMSRWPGMSSAFHRFVLGCGLDRQTLVHEYSTRAAHGSNIT